LLNNESILDTPEVLEVSRALWIHQCTILCKRTGGDHGGLRGTAAYKLPDFLLAHGSDTELALVFV